MPPRSCECLAQTVSMNGNHKRATQHQLVQRHQPPAGTAHPGTQGGTIQCDTLTVKDLRLASALRLSRQLARRGRVQLQQPSAPHVPPAGRHVGQPQRYHENGRCSASNRPRNAAICSQPTTPSERSGAKRSTPGTWKPAPALQRGRSNSGGRDCTPFSDVNVTMSVSAIRRRKRR